jgi:hypothetical protein
MLIEPNLIAEKPNHTAPTQQATCCWQPCRVQLPDSLRKVDFEHSGQCSLEHTSMSVPQIWFCLLQLTRTQSCFLFLQTPAKCTPLNPDGNSGGQQILGPSHPPSRSKSGGPTQRPRCHPSPLPHTCSHRIPLRGGASKRRRAPHQTDWIFSYIIVERVSRVHSRGFSHLGGAHPELKWQVGVHTCREWCLKTLLTWKCNQGSLLLDSQYLFNWLLGVLMLKAAANLEAKQAQATFLKVFISWLLHSADGKVGYCSFVRTCA